MINLLPYRERKIIDRIRRVRMISTVCIGVLCALITIGILLFPTYSTINSRFSAASMQISSLERHGAILSEVDIAALQARSRTVQQKLADSKMVPPTEHIKIVEPFIPSGIVISRFVQGDTGGIEIHGTTTTREVLQGFVNSLETDPRVSVVDNPISNLVKNKNSQFVVRVSFK